MALPNGIVILHKGDGMTSHTAVAKVRRLFGADKAGHTGTLDPMATGVLPVLLGRAVKASAYMTESSKHYLATLRLGLTTDTEDITGTTLTTSDVIPNEAQVREVAKTFVGDILQTPPMYSAIKVGGKRLMELARQGKVVEREARPITVYSLTVTRLTDTDYALDVHCSKGTYIRTLCADIGAALGCGGCMASLARTQAAGFSLSHAHTLEEFERMSDEERKACVIPVEHLFLDAPKVVVADFYAHLLQNGQAPLQKKLGVSFPVGTYVRLHDKEGFFALGIVPENHPDVVKTLTLFRL